MPVSPERRLLIKGGFDDVMKHLQIHMSPKRVAARAGRGQVVELVAAALDPRGEVFDGGPVRRGALLGRKYFDWLAAMAAAMFLDDN